MFLVWERCLGKESECSTTMAHSTVFLPITLCVLYAAATTAVLYGASVYILSPHRENFLKGDKAGIGCAAADTQFGWKTDGAVFSMFRSDTNSLDPCLKPLPQNKNYNKSRIWNEHFPHCPRTTKCCWKKVVWDGWSCNCINTFDSLKWNVQLLGEILVWCRECIKAPPIGNIEKNFFLVVKPLFLKL